MQDTFTCFTHMCYTHTRITLALQTENPFKMAAVACSEKLHGGEGLF